MRCEKSFYLISSDITHITHLKKRKRKNFRPEKNVGEDEF